jgi:hypothetical protein
MKPETRKALEELAEADERSLGNYINRVLDQHVAQHGRVVDLARRRKWTSDWRQIGETTDASRFRIGRHLPNAAQSASANGGKKTIMKTAKPFRTEDYLDSPDAVGSYIVELLLSLPWDQRAAAFDAVQYNGIFCVHCGLGSEDAPNKNCHCTNDE